MFKNYFKTTWRNLIRGKSFSIINIAGLAVGMELPGRKSGNSKSHKEFANGIDVGSNVYNKSVMSKVSVILLFFSACIIHVNGQKVHQYNLAQLLNENKLDTTSGTQTQFLNDSIHKEAISTQRLVYLKGITFSKGTIEVDIRGKDVFLQSFLGIAFHGIDATTYDAVYFRPFNFRHPDSLRRKWAVQYFSIPEYDYDRLRKEHPLVYENAVTPVPAATDWFHATIVVDGDSVTVYVNHSATASLKVKLLNNRTTGRIGLWDDGLRGDFANLTLVEQTIGNRR